MIATTATKFDPACPEVGIYPNPKAGVPALPEDVYHAASGASKSRLWKMHTTSPAHVKASMERGTPDTEALVFGRAFDNYLFERDMFDSRWAVGSLKTWSANKFQLEREEALKSGVDLLTPDMQASLRPMADSIMAHPLAGEIVRSPGIAQTSVFAIDPETGVMMKGRVDYYCIYQGESVHVDLKTARDAEPRKFQRDATDLGYPLQDLHYKEICKALDEQEGRPPRARRFLFIVVEKTPDAGLPEYRTEVFEYHTEEIERLIPFRRKLLERWKECEESGVWPGREARIHNLYVPDWLTNFYGDMR